MVWPRSGAPGDTGRGTRSVRGSPHVQQHTPLVEAAASDGLPNAAACGCLELVALMTFRDRGAEVLIQPTREGALAMPMLRELPYRGRTREGLRSLPWRE